MFVSLLDVLTAVFLIALAAPWLARLVQSEWVPAAYRRYWRNVVEGDTNAPE